MPAQHYREDITGLRAVAVLAVIANHFSGALLPGGNLGVDIFFVISGFVITRSIAARAPGQGAAAFLGQFYERRIMRIGPALLVCVVGTAIVFSLFHAWPREGLVTGASALFGISNFYLFYKGSDYFAQSSRLNPFTHTWSLGVEEQFYLLYPALAFVLLLGVSGKAGRLFAPVMAGLMVLSLTGQALVQQQDPVAAFYLSPFRFWELALGCLLARLPEGFAAGRRFGPAVPPLAFAVLVATLAAPWPTHVAQMSAAVAATGALIAFGGGKGPADRLLLSAPARYLGRISYSLYLWHWPVLAISRLTIGIAPWLAPFQLALMLLLADLSYRKVERRFTGSRLSFGPMRKFATYAGIPAAAATVLLVFAYPLVGSTFAGQRARLEARGANSLDQPYVSAKAGTWRVASCVLQNNLDVGREIGLSDCTLGRAGGSSRLLVVGNSFAPAFLPGLASLAEDPHYRVSLVAAYGAAPVPGMGVSRNFALSSADYWSRVVPAATSALGRGDVVLLVSDLEWMTPEVPDSDAAKARRRFIAGLAKMSRELRGRGVALGVLWGVPFMTQARCNPEQAMPQWFAPGAGKCRYFTRKQTEARMQPLVDDLEELERKGEIVLVGVLDDLCPGAVCSFFAPDGTVLYRDEFAHVSVEGARLASGSIARQLETAFGASEGREP